MPEAAGALGGAWPMTSDARERLVDEIATLRSDMATLAGQGHEEGIVELPLVRCVRRMETLRDALSRAHVVDDPGCAAIGRRVTVRDADGEPITCTLVYPGDGDPSEDLISADSPLGRALLGARPGDTVEVDAPVGRWSATIVEVA